MARKRKKDSAVHHRSDDVPEAMGGKRTMSEKEISQMSKEEVLQWIKRRQQQPLYVASDECDGMSLCYVNPEFVEEDAENESQVNKRPPASETE